MNHYRKLMSITIVFAILASLQIAYAFDDGFFWINSDDSPDYDYADSGRTNDITIIEPGLIGGGLGTLPITIQSKTNAGDPIETLNLVLNENSDDMGIFEIDHIVLMDQESEFTINDTVLVTIEDQCNETPYPDTDGNCDPLTKETLFSGDSVRIWSDTTGLPGAIAIDLIENDTNSGFFTGQLKFCNIPGCSDSSNAILEVSLGDVITVEDQHTYSKANGLISGDPKRFAIIVEQLGTVSATAGTTSLDESTCLSLFPVQGTVTWDSGTCTVTQDLFIYPTRGWIGRGTGSVVRPGLVIDSSPGNSDSSSGGSGCADCNPPTLGIDSNLKRIVKNGFSYNNNPIDVNLYYTPYPLVKVNVGQENKVVLKIFEDGGTQNIEHVGLGFGLAKGESFSDSKATINLDRTHEGTETVSTYDPEHVLDKVRITSERGSCDGSIQTNCMILTIYHTFRQSLKFDMVATYVWDFNGNAWQNYYNHGIHITGQSLNPPKTQSVAFGTNEMKGLFTLTQIDIFEDKWIDEFGNIYLYMGNDRFDKIQTIPKEDILDSMTAHGCDRLCNWFEKYKANQEMLAKSELDKMLLGKEIAAKQKGFIPAPTSDFLSRADDTDLQNRIFEEEKKAQEFLKGHGISFSHPQIRVS